MKAMRWFAVAMLAGLLAACSNGPVRRISEPSARLQQLSVAADGSWSAQVRIENFSSIPMRFDALRLAVTIDGAAAGEINAQPALSIGPESADVVSVPLKAQAAAKLAVADALANGRSVRYALSGRLDATPDQGKQRHFQVEHNSALSPAPGLPGVLR